MALSKKAKIWLIVLAIPVVLIIGAIIFVKIYFTSDRLKALIVPRIEQATDRDVQVGDMSVSIFPSIGVSIENLSVSNPRGATFDRSTTLSLQRLQLNVNLFDLFHNTLTINKIILDRPDIYLEVKEDGTSNIKQKKTGAEEKPGKTEVSTKGELTLSNFEIRNGHVLSIDKQFDARYEISGLNAAADGETVEGKKKLMLNISAGIDKFSYGTLESYFLSGLPVKTEGVLSFLPEEGTLGFDSLSIKLKDLPLSMHGTITNLYGDMMLDLLVTSPTATMDKVLSLVPPDMLKSTKGLSSSGDIDLSVVIKGVSTVTMNPGVRGAFKIANGKIQYASLPKAITNINISGVFEKPAAAVGAKGIGALTIDKFAASLGASSLEGHLNVTNFTDPTVSAAIAGNLNLGEVKEFYPLEQGTEVSGMLKSNVSLDGKAKVPASIRASGSLEFNDVTVKTAGSPKPLQHLNGVIAFNNQSIQSRQLSMIIGESDLSMGFSLNNYLGLVMKEAEKSAKPSASITLTSRQLRTADLASEPSKDSTAVRKKGTTDQTGVLPGFDITASVTIGKLVMQKFVFTNVHGALTASNGIVNLQNLSLNAYDGTITTKGTLDLRDTTKRPFDFNLTTNNVESHTFLSEFSSFGKYLSGKINMTTNLKGDLNDTLGIVHQTLLGNGNTSINDGKLAGFPLTEKLADLTGLESMRQLNFKDWTNAFTITDGRIQMKDFNIHSGVSDFNVGGSQGLDGSLNYTLVVKVPPALSSSLKLPGVASELLPYFKDKDGRFNLNFGVTGSADSPVLKLDTQSQVDMAKQAAVDAAKNKLNNTLQEGLKKIFKTP